MTSTVLVGGSDALRDLRHGLLSAAPNEAAAMVLCHHHQTPLRRWRLLMRETIDVPASAYQEQTPDRLQIDPIFLSRVLKRARQEGASILLTHTHPFSDWPEFSIADDDGEGRLIPAIFRRVPERPHGALVLGNVGFSARLHVSTGAVRPIEAMTLVGRDLQHQRKNDVTVTIDAAHDRNVRAFGDGQKILQKISVGIVGLGGIGSLITEQLAHLGVGNLTLIDFDEVDATNLNRVVGASPSDVGTRKVDVARRLVERISSRIKVNAVPGSVLKANFARALLDCDLIFSCTDTHGSRALLNQLAYQYLVPAIDTGVRIDARDGRIISMAGRVQMLAPGLPCLVCGNLLDPEEVRRDFLSDEQRKADPYITGHRVPQPAVISLNGTVASLAVTMFLSAVVGLPSQGRHLIYLVGESVVRRIGGTPARNCIVCSPRGALARADDWEMIWQR